MVRWAQGFHPAGPTHEPIHGGRRPFDVVGSLIVVDYLLLVVSYLLLLRRIRLNSSVYREPSEKYMY